MNFNATVAATAAESSNLRASVRELGPTIEHADGALTELNAALPPTRVFAREILPGVRETAGHGRRDVPVDQGHPAAAVAGRAARAGGGPAARDRGAGARQPQSLPLLRETNLLSRCVTHNFLPGAEQQARRRAAVGGRTVSEEFWHALVGIAGEGQNFDGNGYYVHLSPGGGDNFLALPGGHLASPGSLRWTARAPTTARCPTSRWARAPPGPSSKPPYRPDVPCYTQKRPEPQRQDRSVRRARGERAVHGSRASAVG